MIRDYNDFVKALLTAGFSMAGGSADGIYAIIDWGWSAPPPFETPIGWHTGEPETDPWEWRMRVLDERDDIAYGKLFFGKSGFITKEWYPYFLAVRREGLTFNEAYEKGAISHAAKRIYDVVSAHGSIPSHSIKVEGGFGKEEKSLFDKALTELQMKMHLTMCGKAFRSSKQEMSNSAWASNTLTTTENFFGAEVFEKADKISKDKAINEIRQQVLTLNPDALEKKITRFILG